MRKLLIILFLFCSIFPLKILAQDSNVGFVSGSIWYSKDPFLEGDKIKIYTLVFNPDKRELSGNVIFFDQTVFLGKEDFVVPGNGLKEVHINWTATVGSHKIFAKIENSKFLISVGKYEDVYLSNNETEKSSRNVSKKILLKNNTPETNNPGTTTTADNSSSDLGLMENIKNTLIEKTPSFISSPINSTALALENFRENLNTVSENKSEVLKKEIEILKTADETSPQKNPEPMQNKIQKPFKQLELFLFTLLSAILKSKFLFYGILIGLFFLILNFIWRKIF